MKNTRLKLSYVYQCVNCDYFHLQPIGSTLSKNIGVRYLPGFGPGSNICAVVVATNITCMGSFNYALDSAYCFLRFLLHFCR
ncbi:hypothetical protein HanHA89_Chr05g0204661 [Helianthus annuus]|nr:hypothetical protein HanHA89_Chr05g0204661 [Helianthus annuus]